MEVYYNVDLYFLFMICKFLYLFSLVFYKFYFPWNQLHLYLVNHSINFFIISRITVALSLSAGTILIVLLFDPFSLDKLLSVLYLFSISVFGPAFAFYYGFWCN